MFAKQISVFRNKKGRLAKVTKLLAYKGINIRVLLLADLPNLGVLRLSINNCERCLGVLRPQTFVVEETDVIAVEVEGRLGGLPRIVEILSRESINIEYTLYFFHEKWCECYCGSHN